MNVLKFRTNDSLTSVIPVEVQAIVAAANAGDVSVLPALKRALVDHPELVDRLGDLAAHVEQGLVALVAGSSLAASEAVAAHLAKMRSELGEADASPLEKLLIRRLVLCWLACHAAEAERAERLQAGHRELLKEADKRVDRAHMRLMIAMKTLATVRKLTPPAVLKLSLIAPSDIGTGAIRSCAPAVVAG